ncbi:hypothetical protein SGLAM104S_05916 [Streptomyces glaucescens]
MWLLHGRVRPGAALFTGALAGGLAVRYSTFLLVTLFLTAAAAAAPLFVRRARHRGTWWLAGLAAGGTLATLVLSKLLDLPGTTDSLQDTFTLHWTRPEITDPWQALLRLNHHYWWQWLQKEALAPLLLFLVAVGAWGVWRRSVPVALCVIAVGATGFATAAAHPVAVELDRLYVAVWLVPVIGVPLALDRLWRPVPGRPPAGRPGPGGTRGRERPGGEAPRRTGGGLAAGGRLKVSLGSSRGPAGGRSADLHAPGRLRAAGEGQDREEGGRLPRGQVEVRRGAVRVVELDPQGGGDVAAQQHQRAHVGAPGPPQERLFGVQDLGEPEGAEREAHRARDEFAAGHHDAHAAVDAERPGRRGSCRRAAARGDRRAEGKQHGGGHHAEHDGEPEPGPRNAEPFFVQTHGPTLPSRPGAPRTARRCCSPVT